MDDWRELLAPELTALVALNDHNSHITHAAVAIGVPQSTMSRRLRALEKALGAPILVRNGRTVGLTPAAEKLTRRVRDALEQLDRAVSEFAQVGDSITGTVRFGFPLTMGAGTIPRLVADFKGDYPGVKVLLKQAHGKELEQDLLAGALDMAVTIPPPTRVPHVRVGVQRVAALLPDTHPLGHASSVSLRELKDDHFVANPNDYNLRQLTETWCHDAGFRMNVSVEATEFATLRELISRGLGVGLLPSTPRLPPGCVEVPLRGNHYQREIALAWPNSLKTEATECLFNFLQDAFEEFEGD